MFKALLSHGKKHPCYVCGNHHLIENIVILCRKSYLYPFGYYVGLERKDCILSFDPLVLFFLVPRLTLGDFWTSLKRDISPNCGLVRKKRRSPLATPTIQTQEHPQLIIDNRYCKSIYAFQSCSSLSIWFLRYGRL